MVSTAHPRWLIGWLFGLHRNSLRLQMRGNKEALRLQSLHLHLSPYAKTGGEMTAFS